MDRLRKIWPYTVYPKEKFYTGNINIHVLTFVCKELKHNFKSKTSHFLLENIQNFEP